MTLCDKAKEDFNKANAEYEAERAKAIITNTTHALAAIDNSLRLRLKPADLTWDSPGIATFEVEGRKFVVRPQYYINNPEEYEWTVFTEVTRERDEWTGRPRFWRFGKRGDWQRKEKTVEVRIRRPADLIRTGVCDG